MKNPEFRPAGNRCAACLSWFKLQIPDDQALAILEEKGFRLVEVNLIALAEECCRSSTYRRGAGPWEAPNVVDCSSLTQWLYAQRGIWLPRRSIQQMAMGVWVSPEQAQAGDLLLTEGVINYYDYDPAFGIGHIGMAIDQEKVVHAANRKTGIVVSRIADFVTGGQLFARRIIPNQVKVLTFIAPPHRVVDAHDDLRWIILQNL